MRQIAVAVVISLLAGFAVGAWLKVDDGEKQPARAYGEAALLSPDASPEERLAHIETALAEEREARFALEDTLAMLFEELERLEGMNAHVAAERESVAEARRQARQENRRSSRREADWIENYQERRVAGMVEGGLSEDEARRILRKESEAAFKALQSSWEAERNGEPAAPFDPRNNPMSILRNEIGDDAYARYLESQGQRASISITQVLTGSPGVQAGLQPGDQLVSYDGARVFSMTDLRNQTMNGSPGEDVVIEVERDGTRMQLTLPRGPIGITGNGARVRGMGWWGG